jgi:DNA polymerase III subunit epsilon
MNYAILDIETTGGSPKNERITEIAIFIHNGSEIIDEFCTLINPEKSIPYFITGLTGISNELVADAPKFFEVARKIVEITEDCIVVGHNVQFDYSFIQNEFRQLGYDYNRSTLCTVKLSRKLIPGFKSYSLGKICPQLGIVINDRHRAAGDALATLKLFELLLSKNPKDENRISFTAKTDGKLKNLNGFLKPDDIGGIPGETGVYYLHDSEENLIYIGKSKNIHKRVLGHLGNKGSRRSMELREKLAGISYELTGSELAALLRESEEIKKHKPRYNRALRRTAAAYGLYSFKDERGYINLRIQKTSNQNETPHTPFNNKKEGIESLSSLIEKHWLCQKLCGMYDTEGACFHYSIRQCNGACIGKESVQLYNNRVKNLLLQYEYDEENLIIIDKGRNFGERTVICIENGVYKGFGYLDINESYVKIEDFKKCIKPTIENKDSRQIIKSWLRHNKVEKILKF